MEIILYGQVPSKKNNKMMVRNKKTGRMFPMTNPRAQEWAKDAIRQLNGVELMMGELSMEVIIFNKDRRKRDLDNQLASINDVLKERVIADDNCEILRDIHLLYGGVDKELPRAEIKIKNI